ncbi:MAG: heme NO-binding domain-containing protein [Cytophagales bacterium]|nr:heme NO-binding domain-containing protein [Cytophagales bacterium]
MYGIVNKAIEGLVTENYGEAVWQKVKIKSEVNVPTFVSNESYDDSVTYKLATAASDVLAVPLHQVLFLFGEYWILKTGLQHYGSLMQAGGTNFREFMINLPNFHSRVMLMYPNIAPPEFKIVDHGENRMEIHYYSTREGLTDFMHGLISGLAKMYDVHPQITLIGSRSTGLDHDEFLVTW